MISKNKLMIYSMFVIFFVSVYSNSTQDVVNPLLYQGFIEETVELLELDQLQFSVSDIFSSMLIHNCHKISLHIHCGLHFVEEYLFVYVRFPWIENQS